MRALVSTSNHSSPAEITEVADPTPASAELLLEAKTASLNRGELSLLSTRPGWRPGQDVAGIVARAAADGNGPKVGTHAPAASRPRSRLAISPAVPAQGSSPSSSMGPTSGQFGRDLEYLARLMGEGKLQPQVGLEVSWKDLGRAMSALRNRQVNGKVVLRID